MSITGEEKVAVFEDELIRIFDPQVREFARLCIIHAPDYVFIDCPSSSSGKYHPVDELGHDGNIIHTKKVFTLAYEMARGVGCDDSRDLICTAALVHDLRKQGLTATGHTVKFHPDLAAQLVTEVHTATQILDDRQFQIIRNCVGYHYGPWSIDPWKKPMEEYTMEEMALYLSDYTVSKRFIKTDYRR